MTETTVEARRADFNQHASDAMLNVYKLAAGEGGHSGDAVTDPYRALLDAAEATFREGAEAGDVQKMVAGWNELTEIAAHIGNSNALLGAALLGTVVRHTGLSPEEAMAKTVDLVESN